MNSIRSIQNLNKKELEAGTAPSASWHRDFSHTAYIYIGGFPFTLSEGDIITIFSQYGEPVFLNLVRDKETGKSKGFAFLKYEDQRSTDLAVDNLGGAKVMGRVLRVDHTVYKGREGEELGDNTGGEGSGVGEEGREKEEGGESGREEKGRRRRSRSGTPERPVLKEERELAEILKNEDEDDPMRDYLVQQKREEVAIAVQAYEEGRRREKKKRERERRHKGRDAHHRSHRHEDEDKARDDEGEHLARKRELRNGSTRALEEPRRPRRSRSASDESLEERRRRRRHGDDGETKEHKRRNQSREHSPQRERHRVRSRERYRDR